MCLQLIELTARKMKPLLNSYSVVPLCSSTMLGGEQGLPPPCFQYWGGCADSTARGPCVGQGVQDTTPGAMQCLPVSL